MYKKGVKEYSQVNIQTQVTEADPHKLIQMLLEGALTRLSAAKLFIEQNQHEAKNERIANVVDIVSTLQESLDLERGGDIAKNLEQLYDYIVRRLWDANRLNDQEIINEVMSLLLEVKAGWEGIRGQYEEIASNGTQSSPSRMNREISA